MYNLQQNNYHAKPKNSTIYTPPALSNFLFRLLQDQVKNGVIFDPCSGQGSLLAPWKQANYLTYGIDLDPHSAADTIMDFFACQPTDREWSQEIELVLCNPPFNGARPKLAPELWLDKIFELFGKDIPLVLFAPIRLRLCSSSNSPRYQKWTKLHYPAISSIISLPTKDTFAGVDCFSEILIFNLPHLQPHYFFAPNSLNTS